MDIYEKECIFCLMITHMEGPGSWHEYSCMLNPTNKNWNCTNCGKKKYREGYENKFIAVDEMRKYLSEMFEER